MHLLSAARDNDLEKMVSAYLECAAWSSTIPDDDSEDLPADSLGWEFSDDAKSQARQECRDFVATNAADLADMEPEQAGHDFWLTRNGHGAGFWDRGLGALGDRLTKAAKSWGSCDVYAGDGALEMS